MSDLRICPKCGRGNPPNVLYCGFCGSSMVSAIEPTPSQPPAPPASPYASIPQTRPPPFDYSTEYFRLEMRTQADRTKTGLLLIVIGIILGPLPFINIIGGLLALVGAILVILGRRAFGETHARLTIVSLVLYIIGFIGTIIAAAAIAELVVTAAFGGAANLADSFANSIQGILIAGVVLGALFGIGQLLFTYALQRTTGRVLLWAGFISSLAIASATVAIIGPQFSQAIRESLVGGSYNPAPIQAVQTQEQVLGLLGLIPAAMYAIAYFMARQRIEKGEIPEPPAPPVQRQF